MAMIYMVQKRGGVWTVATENGLLSFETYRAAIDTAQGAAEVLRNHERTKRQATAAINIATASGHDVGDRPLCS